uniref:26S proteasome regulatory subunit 7 n=1 Tax=Dermatophagoides pteronyssinus TaxID=6956 RepID=A0A6P6YJN6_DERPT
EQRCAELNAEVLKLVGVANTETGLAPVGQWDLKTDKKIIEEEYGLLIGECTSLIETQSAEPKVVVNLRNMAKYLVGIGKDVRLEELEEGRRVGLERSKYQVMRVFSQHLDTEVSRMVVEERPDTTYNDIGGCREQIEKLREVVELPLLSPERFIELGIDPPKGVLFYGPPGTGKTLAARAVANHTDSCFICVIGSELVQRYLGEGARMVRELFALARSKKSCILFIDEVDAIGLSRGSEGTDAGGNGVQRTMLEIVSQLDGFSSRGNIKILMATNRRDTLDPALTRPGRIDRKIEFGLPDLDGRTAIFRINARKIEVDPNIRYELLARLCPNCTGADIRSVCTEAGMFAIRERRKVILERDMLQAINKVVKGYKKFSASPTYMFYN